MVKQKSTGNNHVLAVFNVLAHYMEHRQWPSDNPEGAIETARYIWDNYPGITDITNKFQYGSNPDKHNDLTITTPDGKKNINLYSISGSGNIQPKNLGAKSFLETYFLSPELQEDFNTFLEERHNEFLDEMLDFQEDSLKSMTIKEKKMLLRERHPKFTKHNEKPRRPFLYSLREKFYSLLLKSYNSHESGFKNAFNVLLMLDEITIITRIKSKGIEIEPFKPELQSYSDYKVFKIGSCDVGIQSGQVALTLRFKFESDPSSAIKLATGYRLYQDESDFKDITLSNNRHTLLLADKISKNIVVAPVKNTSNAVGKCNEAFTYYWMLHKYPAAIQADENEFITYLKDYLPSLPTSLAEKIKNSSEQTATQIVMHLNQTYPNAKIEGIQIVADIYIEDRLNTGDIKINIRETSGTIIELFISLKAISNPSQKITTKNPGIGTIFGPNFFGLNSDLNTKLAMQVTRAKQNFESRVLQEHSAILSDLSNSVGIILKEASQDHLRQGIENLLGKALTIITVYEQNKAYLLKHNEIETDITVYPNSPSNIQNTFKWNNGNEELSLRIKFSKGQHHGWSSIKFASEYTFSARG